MRRLLLALGMACLASSAQAQIINPTTLVFTASTDHDNAAVLDHYDVTTLNMTSGGALVFTQAIGKPTYDAARDVIEPLSTLPIGQLSQLTLYSIIVTAVGPAGSAAS